MKPECECEFLFRGVAYASDSTVIGFVFIPSFTFWSFGKYIRSGPLQQTSQGLTLPDRKVQLSEISVITQMMTTLVTPCSCLGLANLQHVSNICHVSMRKQRPLAP